MKYLKKKSNGSIGWGPMISSDQMLTRVVSTTHYYKWENSLMRSGFSVPYHNDTPTGRCYTLDEMIITDQRITYPGLPGSPAPVYEYTVATCVFDRTETTTNFGWRSGSTARDIMVRLTDGNASTIGWRRISDFTSKKGFKYITYEESSENWEYIVDRDIERCGISGRTGESYLDENYTPSEKNLGYTIGVICNEHRNIYEVQYV